MSTRPIYRDPQGNRFTVDVDTGKWREMDALDYSKVTPVGVLQQMGVDWDERFTVKNFSANPGAALAFLENIKAEDGSILNQISMTATSQNTIRSTIAAARRQLFIRTNHKLFCVGKN